MVIRTYMYSLRRHYGAPKANQSNADHYDFYEVDKDDLYVIKLIKDLI